MPPDQGVRFHDGEHASPVDQPCEQDQRHPGRIVGSTGSDATFSVERQRLPKEEILRRQLRPGSEGHLHSLPLLAIAEFRPNLQDGRNICGSQSYASHGTATVARRRLGPTCQNMGGTPAIHVPSKGANVPTLRA